MVLGFSIGLLCVELGEMWLGKCVCVVEAAKVYCVAGIVWVWIWTTGCRWKGVVCSCGVEV